MLSFAVDALVALLLLATIGYAIALNRKLGALRGDRAALDQTALRFTEAATRAEQAVAELRGASSSQGRALEEAMKSAAAVRDDLAFLIERAETALARLEAARKPASQPAPVAPAAPAPTPAPIERQPAVPEALRAALARRLRPGEPQASGEVLAELKQALATLR